MNVRRVLVATNLGQSAAEAVRQAHRWAGSCDAELVVCCVLPPYPQDELVSSAAPELSLSFAEQSSLALRRVVDHVRELTGRSTEQMKVLLPRGSAYAEIIRCASDVGADLIVIGSPSLERKRSYVLGNTAERVLRDSTCSVLVARPSPLSGRVLAATDGSPQSVAAMRAAAAFVKRREGELSIIHCPSVEQATVEHPPFPPPSITFDLKKIREDAEHGLAELIARSDLRAAGVVEVGPAKLLIVKKADEIQAELLAIGATGRTALSSVQLGDTAAFVVRTAPCSSLLVRETARS